MSSGRIEIIVGCMYSGKSTELLRRVSRYRAIGMKDLLINSSTDTRTDTSIKTHSDLAHKAMKTHTLLDIVDSEEYKQARVIGIDEAQFFPDLYDFVLHAELDNKYLIISGLDGDSDRRPFGQILLCIPLCDEIVKLTALDMISKDGTPAIFTKYIQEQAKTGQIQVGATESYIAVSRANF